MTTFDVPPPSVVRRAATIARGPFACPACECPTFTEPPVPWTDLRDYVVQCDSCERPITVHVDRDRVARRDAAAPGVGNAPGMYDPVTELLEGRGARAFAWRLVAAALPPALLAACVLLAGGGAQLALLLYAVLVIPSALWAPAAAAALRADLEAWLYLRHVRIGRGIRSTDEPIEVEAARWDQWRHEQRVREVERATHPDAVLRELERVLDERELRRVRLLAQQGEVPPEHVDDLIRHRRRFLRAG
ncbi:MAG: hypothetical protein JWM86_2450 [Thermoleophilia bacterium]|nr:hypothetical protein [Thermoleophilia bacterium]